MSSVPVFRKGLAEDIPQITAIYNRVLDLEESGKLTTGWIRGVYPTEKTVQEALDAGELFVLDAGGAVVASARINREQAPEYAEACWLEKTVPAGLVMVLHTLAVDPLCGGRGYGTVFVHFYEQYAWERHCPYLRMDTNVTNRSAYRLYTRLGYRDAGVVSCDFNGIAGVHLVCLEKTLRAAPPAVL